HTYASCAELDLEVLSETDQEALEFAWNQFGNIEKFQLADLTHRYPEWKRHEAALIAKSVSRVPMAYEDFLLDPEENLEPCHPLSEEEKQDRRELLRETAAFEARWR
ncbi:MAG TPA: hypothetical protein VIS74_00765, partial [Chthoniobacterales bacterium]